MGPGVQAVKSPFLLSSSGSCVRCDCVVSPPSDAGRWTWVGYLRAREQELILIAEPQKGAKTGLQRQRSFLPGVGCFWKVGLEGKGGSAFLLQDQEGEEQPLLMQNCHQVCMPRSQEEQQH